LNIGALASNPAATAGTLSAASVQLNNNAIVVFNHTTSHYLFSAAINGTGSVSQLGSGTTVLSGTNSYSGGTTITAGTLQGTTNSLQGNIINNSHLVFDQTGTGVFSGTNSGSGDLTKNNLGTVIFNNANSYAGNTFINAGTLQIAAENNLGNGTEVIFGVDANNPAAIGTLAASTDFTLTRDVILNNNGGLAAVGNTVFTVNHISGTGGLTKSGTGTLLLNNPVTYTGNTIISQGTIKAGAANILATSPLLQINNGAQFDLGNISQSTNNLVNNGLITLSTPAPANTAYHTLNVAGAFSGNGTVALNTDLLNQTGDLINISGPTSGSQQILITNVVQSVDPASTSVVKLVQTQGGSGNFTGFTDAGTYRFAILPGNGSALTPDPNAFYLEYTSVLSNTANAAIGLYSSSVYLFYSDMQTLMQRMGEMRLQHGNGYWVRPYANHMIINNQASRSFDQSAGGFDMGVDKSFHKVAGGELNAGVFAGYLNAAQNFHQNNSGTVQGLSLGGYATWFHPEGWYVDAVAKYFQLWNNFHAQSSVGTSSTANYSVPSVGGSLEMGKRFNFLKRGQTFFVEPQLQFRTADIQGMNYAASNALLISGENQTSFQGRIGSQVGMHFELSHHRMVEPYLQASFIEELSGQNTVTTNAIAFNTKIPPSVGQFGAGASMQVSRRAYAYGEYDYAFGRGFHEPVALSAGVRVVW
jgi:outer membrane autotransporter protein